MKSKKSLLMTVFFIVTMLAGMLYTDAPSRTGELNRPGASRNA